MMGLGVLHPWLLTAGLLCVSIPILVHLLRRKHRPISWGAMRFLEQAYRKRRRLITIEQLLLLLTRCAIVALIAGAVGSLVLGSRLTDQRPRTMVIVLDNSIQSGAVSSSGLSSIEYQKQRALELLNTLDPTQGDRAALITIADPAQAQAIPATSELGLIRSRIERITATDAQRDLNGAFELISEVIAGIEDDSIIVPALMLSHGNWNSHQSTAQHDLAGVQSVLLDTSPHINGLNIAVVDAHPLRPVVTQRRDAPDQAQDEIQGVRIMLQRSDSASDLQTTVTLQDLQSDTQLATAQVHWTAGQSQMTQAIPVDPSQLSVARGGSALIRVSVMDTDSNPRDNTQVVGLPIRQQIRVGIIDSFDGTIGQSSDTAIRPSRWVRAVLQANDGLMSIQQINAISAADRIDPTFDVLFVLSPSQLDDRSWDRIARLNAAGMPIIITPDAVPDDLAWIDSLVTSWPELINGTVQPQSFESPIGLADSLGPESGLLAGIDDEYAELAASVTISRRLTLEPGPNASVLLGDTNNDPIVLVSSDGNDPAAHNPAAIILWGVAFDARWTDLPARPIFVALIHEMLRSLLAQSIAPDVRLAGAEAAALGMDTLESILDSKSQIDPDPRLAGMYVQIDQQGISQRVMIVNPEVSESAARANPLQSARSTLQDALPDVDIIELDQSPDWASAGSTESSAPGRPIALMLFAIAAGLAIIELLLARRCSYGVVDAHAIESHKPIIPVGPRSAAR